MTTEEETQRVRPFADVLQELGAGTVAATLSDQLHQLVAAVRETGKGGALTVQLSVKPAAKNDGNTVLVAAVAKLRKPEPEAKASVFFVTSDDNLSRSNPHQPELPLRDVSAPAADRPLKEASNR